MGILAPLRPSSSTSRNAYWTLAGSNAHSALADDSDATYIAASTNGNANDIAFECPDPTLPGGAYPIGLMLMLRTKKVAGVSRWQAGLLGSNEVQGWDRVYFQTAVNWTSPSTVRAALFSATLGRALDTTRPNFTLSGATSKGVTFYEALVVVVYNAQPVVVVDSPSGTLTTDNRPTIAWSRTLDGTGGAQSTFEVKIYDASTHGAFGSVDPDSTTPYDGSGELLGGSSAWRPSVGLPDDDYRAYVRIAQTVNGETHWSEWASTDFEIDVLRPAVPDLALTADNAQALIEVALDENTGAADTDYFEVEVSDDGASWVGAKTLSGAGLVVNPTPGGPGSAMMYEYFGSNGKTRHVRARAVKDHGDGLTVTSAWSATETASWSSPFWWLKHPATPALNITVRLFSLPGFNRPSRQGQFQGVGARHAVVVSDYPGPPQGELTFDLDSDTDQLALDAILADATPLLLQAPPGTHWQDRWISLADQNRRPTVDKLKVLDAQDQLEWIEVEEPVGAITAWVV